MREETNNPMRMNLVCMVVTTYMWLIGIAYQRQVHITYLQNERETSTKQNISLYCSPPHYDKVTSICKYLHSRDERYPLNCYFSL